MSGRRLILRGASLALVAVLAAAPLTAGRAEPTASSDAIRTRVLAWAGGDRLIVDVAADVRYVQGGDAKMTITGPAGDIDDIVADGGVIRHSARDGGWDWRWWRWWNWRPSQAVHIVVTAPRLSEAGVDGPGHLDLGRLAQDRLDAEVSGPGWLSASGQIKSLSVAVSGPGGVRLDGINAGDMSARLSGPGWVKASGAANALHLTISGPGGADLGALAVQDVQADLYGPGSAIVSPKRSADVSVYGPGGVRLLTEPARLNARRFGPGAIIHPSGSS